jgi:hypothetical protein
MLKRLFSDGSCDEEHGSRPCCMGFNERPHVAEKLVSRAMCVVENNEEILAKVAIRELSLRANA